MDADQNQWDEATSLQFLEYGRYFVPDREIQLQLISDLIPRSETSFKIMELACGEGLLAEKVLGDHPNCTLIGLDGSQIMLQKAAARLSKFQGRFQSEFFNLADTSWRVPREGVLSVISSLAIHHLDDQQKQTLFKDVYELLQPGGNFIIADVISPANPTGWEIAARLYDQAVLDRSLKLDQNTRAYDFFQDHRWNCFRYFDPEDIDKPAKLFDQLNWLAGAGFSDIDVYWMSAGHAVFGGFKLPNTHQSSGC